jgi:hypothetical protein
MNNETAQSWIMTTYVMFQAIVGSFSQAFAFGTNGYVYLGSMLVGLGFAFYMGSSSIITFGVMALSAMAAAQLATMATHFVAKGIWDLGKSILARFDFSDNGVSENDLSPELIDELKRKWGSD